MLADSYIGIKIGGEDSPGSNKGLIFNKIEGKKFKCEQTGAEFTEDNILHDLAKGYIMDKTSYDRMIEVYGVVPEIY